MSDRYDEAYDSYKQVHHEGKVSHEVLAGAAAFLGIHEWENQQRKQGKAVKHEFAKELIGALVAAEADKLIETKGRDAWDRHRVKEDAKRHAEDMYDQQYGDEDRYDPESQRPHEYVREHHHHHHNEQW